MVGVLGIVPELPGVDGIPGMLGIVEGAVIGVAVIARPPAAPVFATGAVALGVIAAGGVGAVERAAGAAAPAIGTSVVWVSSAPPQPAAPHDTNTIDHQRKSGLF